MHNHYPFIVSLIPGLGLIYLLYKIIQTNILFIRIDTIRRFFIYHLFLIIIIVIIIKAFIA
jgi:hypothetical protein